ncbi:unnamed protein product [Discosporangium mesarthrocarpum]
MSGEAVKGDEKEKGGTATEAKEESGLEDLQLTATFLTPYAVVPTKDQSVWLSDTRRKFVDSRDQTDGELESSEPVIFKKRTEMASIIGFQGRETVGKMGSESQDSHAVFTAHFKEYVEDRDRTHFRRRDDFSEYAEAKARDPSRVKS